MVVGFNHNFRYKGEVYHIQTEDGGLKSPNIVTLLYRGGTILASKKTTYADIAKVDNLEQVVEELMKEQHKGMLRKLKAGEFDAVIERFESGGKAGAVEPAGVAAEAPAADSAAAAVAPEPATAPAAAKPAPTTPPAPGAAAEPQKPAPPVSPSPTVETSLDEVILSYLMGEES